MGGKGDGGEGGGGAEGSREKGRKLLPKIKKNKFFKNPNIEVTGPEKTRVPKPSQYKFSPFKNNSAWSL